MRTLSIVLGCDDPADLSQYLQSASPNKRFVIFLAEPFSNDTLAQPDFQSFQKSPYIEWIVGPKHPDMLAQYFAKKNILFFKTVKWIESDKTLPQNKAYYDQVRTVCSEIGQKKNNQLQAKYGRLRDQICQAYKVQKKMGAPKRLLTFVNEDQNTYKTILGGVKKEFERLGVQVDVIRQPVDPWMTHPTITEQVYDYLKTHHPTVVFTLGWLPQTYCDVFNDLPNIRLLTWVMDDPFIYGLDTQPIRPDQEFVVIDPTWIPFLKTKAQVKTPIQVMSQTTAFKPRTVKTDRSPEISVSFVGSIVSSAYHLSEWLGQKMSGAQVSRFWESLWALERDMPRQPLWDLYQALDRRFALTETIGAQHIPQFFYHLQHDLSAHKRLKMLTAVADQGLHFYGRIHISEWFPIDDYKPALACFRGEISPQNLPELYQNSRVNLNCRKRQIVNALIQRDWEILDAGGYLLTEWFDDISKFFPQAGEWIAYKTFDQLVDQIDRLRQDNKFYRTQKDRQRKKGINLTWECVLKNRASKTDQLSNSSP